MRLPRKILIRIVIYGALILIFGTRAIMTCQSRNEAARAQAEADAEREALLKQHTRTLMMPDGTTREYLELTPQSAAELGFPVPPEAHSPNPGADAKTKAAESAKQAAPATKEAEPAAGAEPAADAGTKAEGAPAPAPAN